MNLRSALGRLSQELAGMPMNDAIRVSIMREVDFLVSQSALAIGARAHASDLRWHYLIFLSRSRGTPVLQYLLDHEDVFEALEQFALGPAISQSERSFRMKKINDLEVHELFLHLAEKIMKQRTESSRSLTEVFFDLKTLQGQALETKYRRNRSDIRYAWNRVRRFSEGSSLFSEFKGARFLRERLKAFLDL